MGLHVHFVVEEGAQIFHILFWGDVDVSYANLNVAELWCVAFPCNYQHLSFFFVQLLLVRVHPRPDVVNASLHAQHLLLGLDRIIDRERAV